MCGRQATALPQTRQTRCWPPPREVIFPSAVDLRCFSNTGEIRRLLRGGVFTRPHRESRTQRLLWPQTAWFCADAGVCSASVFSDAEGGKAVVSRLSTLLFQIQSRRKADAEQRRKCRRSPSSAAACKPVFSMSLDIRAIRHALRFSPLRRLPHMFFTRLRHRSAVLWICRCRPSACFFR